MAEVVGAYALETAAEGAAVGAYAVARSTLPITGHWTRLAPDIALPRSSHSLCVVDGKAYLFGGEIQPREPVSDDVHVVTLPSGDVETADYTTIPGNSSSGSGNDSGNGSGPAPRVGHTAVAIGRWMYLFGGRGGKEMKPLDERGTVWSFDTRDRRWTALRPADTSPIPDARSYHAAAATSHSISSRSDGAKPAEADPTTEKQHGTVFIHAGCPASGRLADVWSFDVASRVWTRLPDASGAPRGGPALACTSDRLYRFGGFDGKQQLGGQIDYLDLNSTTTNEWQSIAFDQADKKYPQGRSVAGMHHVATGQGRNYLVLLLGERNPSNKGHDGAGEFWDDVWTFQLTPDSMTAASWKDATRGLIGMSTKEHEWDEVLIPEASKSQGRAELPMARGWFASSAARDFDKSSIVLWGGINEKNERLSDGYILTLES